MEKAASTLLLTAALFVIPVRSEAQTAPPGDGASGGDSRLFIGPTARMLAPGEGYLTFDGVLLTTVQIGVTKHFSMGAGGPLVWFDTSRPFWVTPKVQLFNGDRTSVAAGLMNMFVPGSGQVGLAYTVGTIGTPDKSATIGGAVLYAHDLISKGVAVGVPVVLVGGERRLRRDASFLTENYFGKYGGFVSAGLRRQGPIWQISLGGMLSFGSEYAFPGVWFSFAYKFGKRR